MRRPLSLKGKTVVVTRHAGASPILSRALRRLGARVAEFPVTVLRPLADTRRPGQRSGLRNLASYDWIAFTSANTVSFFFARLRALGIPAKVLRKTKAAAIGAKTAAALRRHGVRPALVPKEAVGEALAEALLRKNIKGKKILIPRAKKAREVLPARLRRAGAKVDVVALYEAVPNPHPPKGVPWKEADAVLFTSGSAVRHLLACHRGKKPWKRGVLAACIGPVTARAARRHFPRVLASPVRTMEGLAGAVGECFLRK